MNNLFPDRDRRNALIARAEAAEAALKQAQAERDAMASGDGDRVIICCHCNTGLPHASAKDRQDAIEKMKAHESVCSANPLVRENAKLRADLAAAKQALRDATEWRPIETAPRDGTWVFTRDKHDPAQPIACRWRQDCKAWQDFFGEVWASETHWLPIPPFAQEAQPS